MSDSHIAHTNTGFVGRLHRSGRTWPLPIQETPNLWFVIDDLFPGDRITLPASQYDKPIILRLWYTHYAVKNRALCPDCGARAAHHITVTNQPTTEGWMFRRTCRYCTRRWSHVGRTLISERRSKSARWWERR